MKTYNRAKLDADDVAAGGIVTGASQPIMSWRHCRGETFGITSLAGEFSVYKKLNKLGKYELYKVADNYIFILFYFYTCYELRISYRIVIVSLSYRYRRLKPFHLANNSTTNILLNNILPPLYSTLTMRIPYLTPLTEAIRP